MVTNCAIEGLGSPRSLPFVEPRLNWVTYARKDGSVDQLPLPRALAASTDAHGPEERRDWVARLPETVRALAERWELDVGEPYQPGGEVSWVAPARTATGVEAVLKVGWAHPEAAHEAEGLRCWAGGGAVLLLDSWAFDDTSALLLERCEPGDTLAGLPEVEQDVVVAGLLKRLWQGPDDGPFESLDAMCQQWADEHEAGVAGGEVPGGVDDPLDAGIVRAGVEIFRSLPRTADRRALLCTDLHAANILAAQREPWLVIDPKPHVGDPAYDSVQHMLNCPRRLSTDPEGLARRMADLVGVDPERQVEWLFARCVQESLRWPELAPVARVLSARVG